MWRCNLRCMTCAQSGWCATSGISMSDRYWGGVWAIASTTTFLLSGYLLRRVTGGHWKRNNTITSVFHAVVSASGACLSLWQSTPLRHDMITVFTPLGHRLLAVSAGYFVYDLIDMLMYHRKRSSYELMFHHVLSISCFGVAVWTCQYIGYGVVSLLVEVNSVFLHARQLMIINNMCRRSAIYIINSFINVGTFVVFRLVTLSWMIHWLVQNHQNVAPAVCILGAISLPVLLIMNLILFVRIINSDYYRWPSSSASGLTTLLLEEEVDISSLKDKNM